MSGQGFKDRVFGPPTIGSLRVPRFLHAKLRISADPQQHRRQWSYLWIGLVVPTFTASLGLVNWISGGRFTQDTALWMITSLLLQLIVLPLALRGHLRALLWAVVSTLTVVTTFSQSMRLDQPAHIGGVMVLVVLAATTESMVTTLVVSVIATIAIVVPYLLAGVGLISSANALPASSALPTRVGTTAAVAMICLVGARAAHRATAELYRRNVANEALTHDLEQHRRSLEDRVRARTAELAAQTEELQTLNADLAESLAKERGLAAELDRQSRTDHLTSLRNRRGFMMDLEAHASDGGWLLMVDVDHFKQINDGYGHPVGDAVLRRIAAELSGAVPDGAIVGRVGGEEFAIMLTGQRSLHDATASSDHLMNTIRRVCWDAEGLAPGTKVTVSVGAARWRPPTTESGRLGRFEYGDVIRRADRALYEAKESGRDRTVVADHLLQ